MKFYHKYRNSYSKSHEFNHLEPNIFHILDDMYKDFDELPEFHDQRRRTLKVGCRQMVGIGIFAPS